MTKAEARAISTIMIRACKELATAFMLEVQANKSNMEHARDAWERSFQTVENSICEVRAMADEELK